MEEQRLCSHCGCVLEDDEGFELDDELLCDDCRDEQTVTCDHCGETVWRALRVFTQKRPQYEPMGGTLRLRKNRKGNFG